MKVIILAMLAFAASVSQVTEPAGFARWPAAELERYARELAPNVERVEEGGLAQLLAYEVLDDFGSHYVYMIHRQESGTAELHETETDFYVVESGRATVVVGGEMVDARSTGPREVRGTSLRGGRKAPLEVGDIVNIPAGTAHQVLLDPGDRVTYMIVKIKSR